MDGGNALIKGTTKGGKEDCFPHMLVPITDSDYQKAIIRAGKDGLSPDYVRVNGQPYVVGESAERYGVNQVRYGADRYVPEYYGIIAAALMGRLFKQGGAVSFYGSHAPGDLQYREDLIGAVMGEWYVEVAGGQEKRLDVTYALTFEEAQGGWSNVVIPPCATDLASDNVLVIDVGGWSTDYIGVAPNGKLDYSVQHSEQIGIRNVVDFFTRELRANNPKVFKSDTRGLRPELIREAFETGFYRARGDRLACRDEAEQAINIILNRVLRAYQSEGQGASRWDSIILTGGGSGFLYHRLRPLLEHSRVFPASAFEDIHLANVRGGLKLWKLFEEKGYL